MVAVIRGKLKCYCYCPLGPGGNDFLCINFASVQKLSKKKKKLYELFWPQNRLWQSKMKITLELQTNSLHLTKLQKNQSSVPWIVCICLILWRAIAQIFSQRPPKWHRDGRNALCLQHRAAASTQASSLHPSRRLRNSGLIGMCGEKSSEAQAAWTRDSGLQRKKTEAAGDEIGQTIRLHGLSEEGWCG